MDSFRFILCQICSNTIDNTSSTFATPCGHVVSHQHCLIQQLKNSPNCPVCKRESSLEKIIGLNLIFGDEVCNTNQPSYNKLLDKIKAYESMLKKIAVGCLTKLEINIPELMASDVDDSICYESPQNLFNNGTQNSKIDIGDLLQIKKEVLDKSSGSTAVTNESFQANGGERCLNITNELRMQTDKKRQMTNRDKQRHSIASYAPDFNASRQAAMERGQKNYNSSETAQDDDVIPIPVKNNTAGGASSSGIGTKAHSKLIVNRGAKTSAAAKPFTCDICHRGFSKQHHLTYHKTVHTAEKPYPCKVCDKAFSLKCNLLRHMQSHSVAKPNPPKPDAVES